MKITESRLRQIIRSVIREDFEMRSRLTPEALPSDPVGRAFHRKSVSREELDDLNMIISYTHAYSDERDQRCAEFESTHGAGSLERVCNNMGIKNISSYEGPELSL